MFPHCGWLHCLPSTETKKFLPSAPGSGSVRKDDRCLATQRSRIAVFEDMFSCSFTSILWKGRCPCAMGSMHTMLALEKEAKAATSPPIPSGRQRRLLYFRRLRKKVAGSELEPFRRTVSLDSVDDYCYCCCLVLLGRRSTMVAGQQPEAKQPRTKAAQSATRLSRT